MKSIKPDTAEMIRDTYTSLGDTFGAEPTAGEVCIEIKQTYGATVAKDEVKQVLAKARALRRTVRR